MLEKDTVLRLEMFDHDAVNITSLKEMTALQVRLGKLLVIIPIILLYLHHAGHSA